MVTLFGIMTEERVGFLYNIASSLPHSNETFKILSSYYLMRCNELTKGYGLPSQHFSTKVRCPHCCLEWSRDTEVKTRPIKLSKRQKQRAKSRKKTEQNKKKIEKRKALLRRNEMDQICTFCKQVTATKLMKPEKEYIKVIPSKGHISRATNQKKLEVCKTQKKAEIKKTKTKGTKSEINKTSEVNVYSNAFDIFSLKNENNTLANAVKEPVKVIKNSKKKKDKFAGLCQKAVLASAKLKQQDAIKHQELKSENKLSLFLKPSSS